jgi:hypothetical protein
VTAATIWHKNGASNLNLQMTFEGGVNARSDISGHGLTASVVGAPPWKENGGHGGYEAYEFYRIEYFPASARVKIAIYNVLGQEIRTLVDKAKPAGPHTVEWDGSDNDNRPVSSGIYLYRLRVDNDSESRKMPLLK